MDRRRFVHAAGAGVVLGWLAGCTGTWLRPLKPEVALADVRFEGGNLLEQRFVLTLRVTNPNRFEIPMQGLTFTLDVADQPFAHGMGNRPVTIPALGEALVEVKATTLDRGGERRRKMSPLDLRNWLIHPLRRQGERREN